MPIKLSNIGAKQATVTVEYLGESAEVTYRPALLTPRDEAKLSEMEGKAAIDEMVGQLERVLVEWDVLGDDGTPMEITAENLTDLPSNFLLVVMQAVREDSAPNRSKRGR
jgi:hypothetical protein